MVSACRAKAVWYRTTTSSMPLMEVCTLLRCFAYDNLHLGIVIFGSPNSTIRNNKIHVKTVGIEHKQGSTVC